MLEEKKIVTDKFLVWFRKGTAEGVEVEAISVRDAKVVAARAAGKKISDITKCCRKDRPEYRRRRRLRPIYRFCPKDAKASGQNFLFYRKRKNH
jgi:hypothetical protein